MELGLHYHLFLIIKKFNENIKYNARWFMIGMVTMAGHHGNYFLVRIALALAIQSKGSAHLF